MRIGIMLIVAMLALAGAASAYQETDTLTYSLKKTLSEQNAFTSMAGTTSGTFFTEPNALLGTNANVAATVENKLASVTAQPSNAVPGDTHQTLTQGASVKIGINALSSEDDVPELSIDVVKGQDMTFSGQFKSYSASFNDAAVAGVNHDSSLSTITGASCGNVHLYELTKGVTGTVTANGASKISEGSIGLNTETKLNADGWLNTVTTEGGLSAYATFNGDNVAAPGWDNRITTSVSGTTDHWWNAEAGVMPEI